MEIIVAKHMGFCGGVKRAVEMAQGAAQQADGPVFTWGPLIHNPQVVQRLQAEGVQLTEQLNGLEGEAFVVSAYGVEHAVLEHARAKGMRVVDATCPVVIRAHQLAYKLADEGYQLIVVGDPGHPEKVTLKEVLGGTGTIGPTLEEARRRRLGEEVEPRGGGGGRGTRTPPPRPEPGRPHAGTPQHIEVPDELDPAWFV